MGQSVRRNMRDMKPSEILAKAIDIFTPRKGKPRWNNQYLSGTDEEGHATYCALGALQKAAFGEISYTGYGLTNTSIPHNTRDKEVWDAHRKAAELVAANIPEKRLRRIKLKKGLRYSNTSYIPDWNDSLPTTTGFKEVRATFCNALKQAVELEKQTNGKRKKRK